MKITHLLLYIIAVTLAIAQFTSYTLEEVVAEWWWVIWFLARALAGVI